MIIFELPKLYSRASTGKVKEWLVQVEVIDEVPHIIKTYGYTDGEKQVSKKAIKKGKNLGRSNETTPEQQAQMDAESRWNKKKDELYVESLDEIDNTVENILPMLAHKYQDRKHNIEFPCFVQPKLNGVRCLFQHGDFISRKGKMYDTLDHMRGDLEKLSDIGIVDGEIFSRDMTFQTIAANVKKLRDTSKNLEYWIYDQINDKGFEERMEQILFLFVKHGEKDVDEYGRMGSLVFVPTIECHNEEDIMKCHKAFTADGFEGTIIRNKKGKYKPNLKRSADLQKYKDFLDSEYEIIGGKEATGNEEGCIVFKCKTDTDGEFDVRPRGTRELRRRWYGELDSIIGKMLTVRYQELSDDGIPIFPVGITIRDYE